MSILILRFAVRLRTVGVRGFQLDDLFSFLVVIMYTCDAVTVHLVCKCNMVTDILSKTNGY